MVVFILTSKKLNILYTSKNYNDIKRFYDYFGSDTELIKWMKNRRNEKSRLIEVLGKKDLIFIVPTANFKGKYAQYCKKLYKGHYTIFVESSGNNFNFSRSCNLGIKRALELKPKWVVISNDDVYGIDNVNKFTKQVLKVNPCLDTIFIKSQNVKRIYNCRIIELSHFIKIYYKIKSLKRKYYGYYPWFFSKYRVKYLPYISNPSKNTNLISDVVDRFCNTKAKFRLQGTFIVLSYEFIKRKKGRILDETYINGFEDTDLFYTLEKRNKYTFVNFNIGAYSSGTLRYDKLRDFKGLANLIYFNYKFRKEF